MKIAAPLSSSGQWCCLSKIRRRNQKAGACRSFKHEEIHYSDYNIIKVTQRFAISCVGVLLVSNTIPSSSLAEESETLPVWDPRTTEIVDQRSEQEDNMNTTPDTPVDEDLGAKTEQKSTKRKGRIRELEEIKAELAKKELELLSKENALLEKEQNMIVLRQELEIERNIRAIITKEKEQAEEEAALAMGLCTGSTMLP